MKKIPTVTIGISAYNEEANIKHLLKSLLKQNQKGFKLSKIIVVSDASSDNTDKLVDSIKDNRIKLIRNSSRQGKPLNQNIIVRNSKSDLLVILDADTLPSDKNMLYHLVNKLSSDKNIGLVGGNPVPLPPDNYLGKVLHFSVQLKEEMYNKFKSGHNIYHCHGRIRAFKKTFLNKFKWTNRYNEDAFSYMVCLKKGFDFKYEPKASVNYKLPTTLFGHIKQSTRFMNRNEELNSDYPEEFIKMCYEIPRSIVFITVVKNIIKHPFYAFTYSLLLLVSKIFTKINSPHVLWDMSDSTKRLVTSIYKK